MDTFAQNALKGSGNCFDQRTVKFGSGAGPRLYNVFKKRYVFLVTSVFPFYIIPPRDSVIHIGSPPNNSL